MGRLLGPSQVLELRPGDQALNQEALITGGSFSSNEDFPYLRKDIHNNITAFRTAPGEKKTI